MKLFKIQESTKVLMCELGTKNDNLIISSENEEVLKEEQIFEIEEILIDPLKRIDDENYIEKVEYILNYMGIKDCDYIPEIESIIYEKYYGFVTDIKNKKIMLVPHYYVDVI